ncbi:hypothetical protein [Streptomyces sp. NRRL WC-3742]|uniref:hypothetical protein n=1 Tax=Streptomyces sp. NRRL WC-3742 TaxID=1463934 RepID=UPI00131A62AF|nr:hypothetical protein [Streptomyces sp. NRRL WC-3742]
MIGLRTAVRLAAVTAVAAGSLGLTAGVASADATYAANVPGCAGGMNVQYYNGHDWVQGYVISTMGNYCTVYLHQSNGNWSSAYSNVRGDEHYTLQLQDSGITSYVTVCNADTGRCATSTSY